MHDLKADAAFLVTTGQVSKAARAWSAGKPIQFWDAERIQSEWGAALALLAKEIASNVAPWGPATSP
jgi:hypothetical protein